MKGNIKMALFAGFFVVIITLLFEYIMPDKNLVTTLIIVGLSGLIGGLVGKKLFQNDQ